MNYYNENDKNCVAWLKGLIAEKLIAPGDVDDRDIRDVRPTDIRAYTQCHFFAGIGGWPLALAIAGVGPDEPLWTGSCPCQPFSAAGRRGGFADERHLWPSFYHLITQCRPAVVLGEQVASAADWLRLVRGDLEALDYAVGCCPVEAASAGADHLRDRYWFVANSNCPPTRCNAENVQEGQPKFSRASNSVALGDAHGARPQGRYALSKCGSERLAGQTSMADADSVDQDNGKLQRSGQFLWPRGDQEARAVGDGSSAGSGRNARSVFSAQRESGSERSFAGDITDQPESPSFEWVIGADQKIRRVKSGVRLLVNGLPHRVGLLRGFGNAIDPRPAAAFIQASLGLAP